MNKKEIGECYEKKFCPKCKDENLTITSEVSYICNNCGHPNKIKINQYEKGKLD